jgi:uncharacterized repeat protein (TIGR01451 family)
LSSTSVAVGQNLTFTLTVVNHGPSAATGVTLTDTLPSGVVVQSKTASQGGTPTQSGNVVTANLGGLAPGATATVTIVVQPTATGSLLNSAQVKSNETDSVPANNLATVTATVTPAATGNGPTVVNTQRFGFHMQPTNLVLTFSSPLNATSAQNLASYRLVSPGPNGTFGDSDDRVIAITAAQLDATGKVVTLIPAQRLPLRRQFQLTVNGQSGGIIDTSGRLLDGDHNGTPGGNFVVTITRDLLAGPASQFTAHSHVRRLSPHVRAARSATARQAGTQEGPRDQHKSTHDPGGLARGNYRVIHNAG